ncbi:MAG: restriction endonuclease subunit S [Thermodesulfobacteriota bacterium]
MKYPAYPRYKDSGVEWLGEIPAHWDAKKLKFLAEIRTSNVDKKSEEGELPVRLCNYVDVYKNDFISSDIEFMQATATKEEINRFKIQKDDVLITKDSESWDDIAVPACVGEDFEDVVCGYHLAQIRPNKTELRGRYLFRCFSASGICDQFKVAANGVTRFGLPQDAVGGSFFPVPPLEEQTAIAAFLDRETARIDGLIARKQRLVELLQEKRTALISRAVTKGLDPNVPMKDSGIEWLGEIPAHWEVYKFRYVFKMKGGMTPEKGNPEYWNGEIPWVSPKDMKKEIIADSEDHITSTALNDTGIGLVPPQNVLIVVRGMILAHTFPVAMTAGQVTINQDMKALVPIIGFGS